MPLTQEDADRVREIAILANEIRAALNPSKDRSQLSDFSQQIILLLLGFTLTTLAGGILTAWWKSHDLENQRGYLEKQKALDRAYALISQTSKEVATTVAAADDVLATYEGDGWTVQDIKERHENWAKSSRNWRINSQVLRAQIVPTFSDSTLRDKFDEIIKVRVELGRDITNLPRGKKAIAKDKNLQREHDSVLALIHKITGLLYDCVDRMIQRVNTVGGQ